LQQLEKAKADLRGFQVRLESCRILAPFDGLVSEKLVQKHEIAQLNQPLIKIVNQNRLELVMMVPSQWLPQIAGQTFQITIDETGEAYGARILQSTGVIDPVSQTARVIAEFVEPTQSVLPGMSGSAQLLQIKAQQ
jgi:multidrug efflux pump subunit AcrA (membrane-fusion protein)